MRATAFSGLAPDSRCFSPGHTRLSNPNGLGRNIVIPKAVGRVLTGGNNAFHVAEGPLLGFQKPLPVCLAEAGLVSKRMMDQPKQS